MTRLRANTALEAGSTSDIGRATATALSARASHRGREASTFSIT